MGEDGFDEVLSPSAFGFVDNDGEFLTRQQAATLALEAGQLEPDSPAFWDCGNGLELEADAFNRLADPPDL